MLNSASGKWVAPTEIAPPLKHSRQQPFLGDVLGEVECVLDRGVPPLRAHH